MYELKRHLSAMTSNDYLYQINSRDQLAGWARSLRFFRFIRAGGGLLNDGDVLQVRLRCADAIEREQLLAKLDQPPGVALPAELMIEGVRVSAVIVPDGLLLMISDDTDPYIVTEAAVSAAQKVEQKLVALAPWLIDPPSIRQNCICPQRFPEFWPPRYQYSWPLKWQAVVYLLPLSGMCFLLAILIDTMPSEINLFFATLGLVVLVGTTTVGLLKTTISVDTYGDFMITHGLWGFTFFHEKVIAADIVRVEIKTMPVKVNPGVRPRDYYAFNLVHRNGTRPINTDDDLSILEKPALDLTKALCLPLQYTKQES